MPFLTDHVVPCDSGLITAERAYLSTCGHLVGFLPLDVDREIETAYMRTHGPIRVSQHFVIQPSAPEKASGGRKHVEVNLRVPSKWYPAPGYIEIAREVFPRLVSVLLSTFDDIVLSDWMIDKIKQRPPEEIPSSGLSDPSTLDFYTSHGFDFSASKSTPGNFPKTSEELQSIMHPETITGFNTPNWTAIKRKTTGTHWSSFVSTNNGFMQMVVQIAKVQTFAVMTKHIHAKYPDSRNRTEGISGVELRNQNVACRLSLKEFELPVATVRKQLEMYAKNVILDFFPVKEEALGNRHIDTVWSAMCAAD